MCCLLRQLRAVERPAAAAAPDPDAVDGVVSWNAVSQATKDRLAARRAELAPGAGLMEPGMAALEALLAGGVEALEQLLRPEPVGADWVGLPDYMQVPSPIAHRVTHVTYAAGHFQTTRLHTPHGASQGERPK